MENKKINVPFYLAVIFFLVFIIILVKDFNAIRVNDFKKYAAIITNIVKQENNKIRVLSNLSAAKEKENTDLNNTLADTRNELDALSKKLVQPAPKS